MDKAIHGGCTLPKIISGAALTTLYRNKHIAEWIKLTEAQTEDGISRQNALKIGRGRPLGGIAAAARELEVENTEAKRIIKIAGITPEGSRPACQPREPPRHAAKGKA